jgi:hypothetical protein
MTNREKHGPLKGCEEVYTSRTGEWTERPADELEWAKTTCALICGHNVICPTCGGGKNDRIAELVELAEHVVESQKAILVIMQKHGIVIDDHSDPMQKFAFTVYSYLAGCSGMAERLLAAQIPVDPDGSAYVAVPDSTQQPLGVGQLVEKCECVRHIGPIDNWTSIERDEVALFAPLKGYVAQRKCAKCGGRGQPIVKKPEWPELKDTHGEPFTVDKARRLMELIDDN